MSTVEELIGNLLLRHNCVIVPSFGGFVAKQSSATIDYKNGVMLPPRKSVLFNRQLVNSDGLLVSEFALVNNIYYTAAEETVRERVSDWNEKLRNGERITLDRVGYLFYDQEKNICFEQDRFFNLLLESYGLGKVHFVSENDIQIAEQITVKPDALQVAQENAEQPVIQLVPVPVVAEVTSQTTEKQAIIIDHPEVRKSSKVWKYVAAAVLLPIGFYSFWIPMKTNVLESGVLSFKDFNLMYTPTEGKYEPSEFKKLQFKEEKRQSLAEELKSKGAISTYPFKFEDYTNIYVRVPKTNQQPEIQTAEAVPLETATAEKVEPVVKKKEVTVPIKKETPTPAIPNKAGNFDFIVGSFTTRENAEVLVAQLKEKGLPAYVITVSETSHRVSAGNASSSTEITSIGDKAKANGFNGWVAKK